MPDSVTPLPPLATIPPDLRNLADYERRAPAHMPARTWQHIQEGAGAGLSLAGNQAQFDRLRLVPRMLADLRGATTAVDLFGIPHAAPVLLAPVAYHQLVHPQGELATVAAAVALATTMVASTLSSVTMEEIAAGARAAATELGTALPPLWYQLYFQPDRAHTRALVRRAEDAGYRVLVVTVDAAVKQSGFALPPGIEPANLKDMPRMTGSAAVGDGGIVFGTPLADAAPGWDDLAWLRSITRLPLVVKGLLSPDDARLAAGHGADGIVVSNHGGRIVDGTMSPLDALPAMAAAVEGRVSLLLDGGVRRGTDVLKALALGARAVLVGRPQLHALAVAGIPGVAHMLHLLRAELELAMAQTGCASVAAVGPQLLAE